MEKMGARSVAHLVKMSSDAAGRERLRGDITARRTHKDSSPSPGFPSALADADFAGVVGIPEPSLEANQIREMRAALRRRTFPGR
jgi:hypothetical protein